MMKQIGEYVLDKRIGSGAFAQVYKGYSLTTSNTYAIKVVDVHRLADKNSKLTENLNYEIRILKELSHPNIVRLFDVLDDPPENVYIYMIMECCEGGDFSKYIRQHKKLTEEKALYFMKQLARGLKFLRQRDIVHRDLKPQNLLLSDESDHPILKIGDFGFAKFIDVQQTSDTFCGSPLYMAPEILYRKNYTVKADLWSVGVILYEMLVGEPAYNCGSVVDLLDQLKNKKLKMPPHVSLECQDLIFNLLQIDVNQRISWENFFGHPWLNLNDNKTNNNNSNNNNYNISGNNSNNNNNNNNNNYYGSNSNSYSNNNFSNNNNNNNISYPISINNNGNNNSNNNNSSGYSGSNNYSPPNYNYYNDNSNNNNNNNQPNSLPFSYNNIYSSPTDGGVHPTLNKSKSFENTGAIKAHPFKEDKKQTNIGQPKQQPNVSNLASDFEKDLVILDDEALESIERILKRAVAIAELGDLRQNEPLECIPLYLLALNLMKSKIPKDSSSLPDKFKNTFKDYTRKLVHIFSTSNTSVKYHQDHHLSSFSPNRFIYENAMEFGKKGAVEELYKNYSTSLHFYTDASLLLDYLFSVSFDKDDQEILKKYMKAFNERIQICKKNVNNSNANNINE